MSKMKYYVIGLSIAIVIYAPVVSWLTIRDIIVPPDLIDSVILFILASATIFYAVRTSDIAGATEKQAKATKEQADASVKMAKEMKEQRLTVSQPLIFPDFSDYKFPANPTIPFTNLGNGPALNVKVTFAYAAPDLVKREWKSRTGPSYSKAAVDKSTCTIITVGSKIECIPYLTEDKPGNIGTAFVEYSDIYGRCFLAGWGYQCGKDNKGYIILHPTVPIYPLVREGVNHD